MAEKHAEFIDADVQGALVVGPALDDSLVIEPGAEEFFACSTGVCVYINAGGSACRVQFDSPDGPGTTTGLSGPRADDALAVATSALRRHSARLAPLFAQLVRAPKFRA